MQSISLAATQAKPAYCALLSKRINLSRFCSLAGSTMCFTAS